MTLRNLAQSWNKEKKRGKKWTAFCLRGYQYIVLQWRQGLC